MYNYGHFQVLFADGSLGWYEAGWGPMMSDTAFFVKDVVSPNGAVSIRMPETRALRRHRHPHQDLADPRCTGSASPTRTSAWPTSPATRPLRPRGRLRRRRDRRRPRPHPPPPGRRRLARRLPRGGRERAHRPPRQALKDTAMGHLTLQVRHQVLRQDRRHQGRRPRGQRTASSASSSAPPAAASPRCCASSPGSRTPPPATS